jgi:hypothetical protein
VSAPSNYDREFGAFPNMLHAGERAPDDELQQLEAFTEFKRAEEIRVERT